MPIKEALTLKGRSVLTVTAKDFAEFLTEKSAESICPSCGADEWTIVCPPEDESNAFRLMTAMKDGIRPAWISMFAIYCDNCGYVRHHAARVVKSWVDDNQLALDLITPEDPDDE